VTLPIITVHSLNFFCLTEPDYVIHYRKFSLLFFAMIYWLVSEKKAEVEHFLNTCELSCLMQEFIGIYIMMEEYFMRQMVVKVDWR